MSVEEVADGRIIRLAGLPNFNDTDVSYRITGWEGLFSTPPLDAQYTPAGGSAGAIASGPWLPKERPMVLTGYIEDDIAALPGHARAVAAALSATAEATIEILANGRDDLDLQIFVRRYDKADFPIRSRLDFTVPLLALDPYLYGLDPLSAGMGVNSGTFWYRSYVSSSGWRREYVDAGGGSWTRQFSNVQPAGPYPDSAALTPAAGASTSRRITFTVAGPLTAGDWQLTQVDTPREMWVQTTIPSGQFLTIDAYTETVMMNGEDLTDLLYGDMLTLEAAGSTYQLTSSTPNSDAYALVSALPAYEI